MRLAVHFYQGLCAMELARSVTSAYLSHSIRKMFESAIHWQADERGIQYRLRKLRTQSGVRLSTALATLQVNA